MTISEGQLTFGDKVGDARLRWFGCVQSRDSGYIRRNMLDVGAVRQEINRKTSENVHGCNEEGPVEV